MTGSEVVYIAVTPKSGPEAELIGRVAAIVNKDLFGTRALLTGKIPRVVGYYPDLHTAELVAQKLRELGLVTLVCKGSELRKPASHSLRAHSLELTNEGVMFRGRDRQVRTVDPKDVFLILRGTARSETDKESTTTKVKLSVPATMLTGGIPVFRKVQDRTKTSSIKTEEFVRLYGWTSVEPMVEIFQYDFDYSSLAEKKRLSSLENMNIVTTELRDRFPLAAFDDRLTKHFKADVPFSTPGEAVEINCRLICLYYRAVSNLSA